MQCAEGTPSFIRKKELKNHMADDFHTSICSLQGLSAPFSLEMSYFYLLFLLLPLILDLALNISSLL